MRWLLLCALAAGCGDNTKPAGHEDAPRADAVPIDGVPGRLTGCLDRPGLPSAPAGALPCDLVPPGLQL